MKSQLRRKVAASLVAAAAVGGGSAGIFAASANAAVTYTIKAFLPQGTGTIGSPDNAAMRKVTAEYESAHPDVKVDWLPNMTSSSAGTNVQLVTQAAGGDAVDLPWEQYGEPDRLPPGILANMTPFVEKPNPYVPGNKAWIDLLAPSVIPYMTSPNGEIQVWLSSTVETAMFYNKADFAKARIASAPSTWAEFASDLAALKTAGFTPLMFGTGGGCNPSWWERLAMTSLLANQLSKFKVSASNISLDVAVGVQKGIISFSNPSFAEVWKLLGQLIPYNETGASSYDACVSVTSTTPPLSTLPLLTQGKVAIIWGGSWYFPQLASLGFAGKYGVFAEPRITKATTPYATGISTEGVIGGPNGPGEWGMTTEKADHTMTPAKTAVVMNFLAWLTTPKNLGYWLADATGNSGIPTEPTAPAPNIPGIGGLVPTGKVAFGLGALVDGLFTPAAATTGQRLIEEYMNGTLSYTAFASAYQQALTSGAAAWAAQNHVDLSKY